jgi:hypothetical protein
LKVLPPTPGYRVIAVYAMGKHSDLDAIWR